MESVSSIGPLQLSPRGTKFSSTWKTGGGSNGLINASLKNESTFSNEEKEVKLLFLEESKLHREINLKNEEISKLKNEISSMENKCDDLQSQLVTSQNQIKKINEDLDLSANEIRDLKTKESKLIETLECIKKENLQKMEDLQNKLSFENAKVKKVYEEIKELEFKKIEIEEAFFNLKDDYCEKLNEEQKTVKTLMEKVRNLESKNCDTENKLIFVKNELKNLTKDSEANIKVLNKQVSDLKKENEMLKSVKKTVANAEVQVNSNCSNLVYDSNLSKTLPKTFAGINFLNDNIKLLKQEFDKMSKSVSEMDRGEESVKYNEIKILFSSIIDNINELIEEFNAHTKKIMESSVDDLAIKVKKELLLSAKLDHDLLTSFQNNDFAAAKNLGDEVSGVLPEYGGGDFPRVQSCPDKSGGLSQELIVEKENEKIMKLEKEKKELLEKIHDHQKIIKFLEESLLAEKERILAEKERCKEDANIMELLRKNLEKGLRDIKAKEKDVKKERQLRMALEKELEALKKDAANVADNNKIANLKILVKSHEDKLEMLSKSLENEKIKNQELRILLEQKKLEKISEKEAYKLLESDYNLLQDQKANISSEVCM